VEAACVIVMAVADSFNICRTFSYRIATDFCTYSRLSSTHYSSLSIH